MARPKVGGGADLSGRRMYWNDRAMKLVRNSARTARRRTNAGYSLLEILIVLAIIALIVALVGPRLFAQLDHAKVTTARVQVKSLETADRKSVV